MKEIKLTEEYDNKRIKLSKGDVLVIELPSNRTTGFSWDVAEYDKTILSQQGEPQYVLDFEGENPPIGAGGREVFTFAAKAPGKTRLKLVYRRQWEKGVAPVSTFTVSVTVR